MKKLLIYTDSAHGELPIRDAIKVITPEWVSEGNHSHQTVIDLRNALEKLYLINCKRVIDHIEAICPKCGHETTEDGCAYCINERIRPLIILLKKRVGDKESGFYGTIKIDDELITKLELARESEGQ